MKRKIIIALCLALSLSGSVHADTGIWITKHYVDEFKQPTDEAYVTTDKIKGTFSNTATTDSLLYAYILIDDKVSFKLYEYGDNPVTGYLSDGMEYDFTVLAPDGEKTKLKGYLNKGSDRIVLYDYCVPYFFDILNQNGKVSILIKRNADKYLFTLDDTTGIADEYLQSFDTMPHHNAGTEDEINVELERKILYKSNFSTMTNFYDNVVIIQVSTNLPDGTRLYANAKSSKGYIGDGDGTVEGGSCEIYISKKQSEGIKLYIDTEIYYRKDQPDYIYEKYGESLDKFTGEISDKIWDGYEERVMLN